MRYVMQGRGMVGRVAVAVLLVVVMADRARAQDAPDAPDAPGAPTVDEPKGLHADELLVLLCDHYGERYNAAELFGSTLPGFARLSRRGRADRGQRERPMPIGVISFTGTPPESLDVLLELEDAEPLYAWPPATTSKDTRILWARLLLDHQPDAVPEIDSPDHWINTLRTDAALVVRANRKAGRALLYDVQINGKNPLKLGKDGGAYTAQVVDGAAVRDAFLFKPTADGTVRSVRITFDESDQTPTTAADESHPSAEAALAALTAALREDGTPAHLAALASATVGRVVEDEDGNLVAVARMKPAFMERRLPLEITPAPASVSRTALVVVINADPDLVGRIDELIAQLGDPSWSKRQAAHEQLAELGEVAQPRLKANRGHADPEIAFRVQALLEAIGAGDPSKDG